MSPALQAILASTLSSLLGLTGGFLLLWQHHGVKRFSHYFVSFAAGALLGAAFFDLLVEAIEGHPDNVPGVFAWVMAGFLLFFLIEKLLLWHHHSHREEDEDTHPGLAPLIIAGDVIHNLIDGSIIAGAFLVNPGLGIATAIAVFFHELPQEIGDFSIMIHGGMSRRSVALWNILGALVSPLATAVTLLVATRIDNITLPLIGLAAGNFIYIAAADLVPEIHREKKALKMVWQFLLLVAGLLTIVWLSQHFQA